MRWFKHLSNARRDTFLLDLRHKFGSDGYTAWFITVEMLAEIVKPETSRARIKANPRVFSDECMIPPDRLENIYQFASKRGKLRFRRTKTDWIVEIAKVLEFRDEYSRKGPKKSRDRLRSPSGETPEESRADTEQKQLQSKKQKQKSKKKNAAALKFPDGFKRVCEEFESLTARPPLAHILDLEDFIPHMEALIEKRGVGPCIKVMKEKTREYQDRNKGVPSSLRYFIPVFEDDRLFENGSSLKDWEPPDPKDWKGGPFDDYVPPEDRKEGAKS